MIYQGVIDNINDIIDFVTDELGIILQIIMSKT